MQKHNRLSHSGGITYEFAMQEMDRLTVHWVTYSQHLWCNKINRMGQHICKQRIDLSSHSYHETHARKIKYTSANLNHSFADVIVEVDETISISHHDNADLPKHHI